MAVALNRVTTTPVIGDLVLKGFAAATPVPAGWTVLQEAPDGRRVMWRRCTPGDVWRPGMIRIDNLPQVVPWAPPANTTLSGVAGRVGRSNPRAGTPT